MNEEEFYKTTPRKLFKLAEIHNEINKPTDEGESSKTSKDSGAKYIDQIDL